MADGESSKGIHRVWLHAGDWRGNEFSHELPTYEHDESPGSVGTTAMKHIEVARDSGSIGVWVPAEWTDDQVLEALENNW
nr:hypothetical protein [uncultured Devosia sp.]